MSRWGAAGVRRMLPPSALGTRCPDCRTLLKRGGKGGKRRATARILGDRMWCVVCAARRRAVRTRASMRGIAAQVMPASVQLGGSTWWRAAVVVDSLDSGRRERHVGPRLYKTSAEALARAGRWARSWGRKSA